MSLQCYFNIYYIPCLTSITITITKSGTSAWPPVPPLNSFSLSFFSIGTLQFRRQKDIDVDDEIDVDVDIDHSDQNVDGDQDQEDHINDCNKSQDATDGQRRSVNPRLQVSYLSFSYYYQFASLHVKVKGEHLSCRGIAAYIHL